MTSTSHPVVTDEHGNASARDAAAHVENLRVRGDALAEKVKALLHEGTVQRIVVRNSDGERVIEIPVSAGLIAAVVAPVVTGVAAIAALASDRQIDVHRGTNQPRA